ncbi:hypothetical protein AAMO2058_001352700 [Amorphochlora amoebiformis]
MVRLTMPLPDITESKPLQYTQMQKYKCAVVKSDMFAVLLRWIQTALAKPDSQRSPNDLDSLELFLTFCVNLLKIPNPTPSSSTHVSDDWTHLQDRLILKLHEEAILDVFIVLSITLKGSKFALIMLDIFYHLYRDESPESLVYPVSKEKRLEELVLREETKKVNRTRALSTRHSRFGSQFAIRHALNQGSTQIVSSLGDSKKNNILNKAAKTMRSGGRKKMKLDKPQRSYLSDKVPIILAENLSNIIETSFGSFMTVIQEEVMDKLQSGNVFPQDTRNYMEFTAIALGYHRLQLQKKRREHEKVYGKSKRNGRSEKDKYIAKKKKAASKALAEQKEDPHGGKSNAGAEKENMLPKETQIESELNDYDDDDDGFGVKYNFKEFSSIFDEHIFKWTITKLAEALDLKPIEWEKLGSGILILSNMLHCLHDMVAYGDSSTKRLGVRIQRNIFYQDIILTMLMRLVREYKIIRNPRSYLANLVKSVYFVMRMLAKIDDCHASEFLMKTRVKVRKRGQDAEAKAEYVEKEFTFESNPDEINDCILRFFQKLALDLKAVPVFFQLNYFLVFEKILESRSSKKVVLKLQDFARYIIAKFSKIAMKNKIVFLEFCFLKTLSVCESIYHPEKEVISMAEKAKRARYRMKQAREQARAEMQRLGQEVHEEEETLGDEGIEKLAERAEKIRAGEEDLENIGVSKTWTSEEDELLKENFDEFKDLGEDAYDILAGMLPGRERMQVSRRLRKLGLVKTKRRKKKSSKKGYEDNEDMDEKDEYEEMEPESEDEVEFEKPSSGYEDFLTNLDFNLSLPGEETEEFKFSAQLLANKIEYCSKTWKGQTEPSDYPIIPLDSAEFDALRSEKLIVLMRELRLREPSEDSCEIFWRIPTSLYDATHLESLAKHIARHLEASPQSSSSPTDHGEKKTSIEAAKATSQDPDSHPMETEPSEAAQGSKALAESNSSATASQGETQLLETVPLSGEEELEVDMKEDGTPQTVEKSGKGDMQAETQLLTEIDTECKGDTQAEAPPFAETIREGKSETQAGTQPYAKTIRKGDEDTQAETQPLAETQAETQSLADTQAETQPLADTLAETQPLADTLAETQPSADTLAETQPLADTQVETQPFADTQAETQPFADTQAETQPLADTLAETQPLADTQAKTQPLADTLAETKNAQGEGDLQETQPLADTLAETQPLVDTQAETQPFRDTQAETQALVDTQDIPRPLADPQAETQPLGNRGAQTQHLANTQGGGDAHAETHPLETKKLGLEMYAQGGDSRAETRALGSRGFGISGEMERGDRFGEVDGSEKKMGSLWTKRKEPSRDAPRHDSPSKRQKTQEPSTSSVSGS